MEENEEIPPTSMWKMIHTTMPLVLNVDASDNPERALKILINILQKPENSGIFIFNVNSSFSWEEYNLMCNKYKAFTVWLLGRLYYLLNEEKLQSIHNVIIEAQKTILSNFKNTQPHTYRELMHNYVESLKQLNKFASHNYQEKIKLNVFNAEVDDDIDLDMSSLHILIDSKAKCVNMQGFALSFIEDLLIYSMVTCNAEVEILDILEILLVILKTQQFSLKLSVLKIYKSIAKFKGRISVKVNEYLMKFHDLLKQLVINQLANNNIDNFKSVYDSLKAIIQSDESLNELICEKLRHTNEVGNGLRTICNFYEHLSFNPNHYTLRNHEVIHQSVLGLFIDERCPQTCLIHKNLQQVEGYLNVIVNLPQKSNQINYDQFVIELITHIQHHLENCSACLDYSNFINIMKKLLMLNLYNFKLYYELALCLLNKQHIKSLRSDLVDQNPHFYRTLNYVYNYLNALQVTEEVFESFCQFLLVAVVELTSDDFEQMQNDFYSICMNFIIYEGSYRLLVAKYFMLLIYRNNKNISQVLSNVLLKGLFVSDNEQVLVETCKNLNEIIVALSVRHKLVKCKSNGALKLVDYDDVNDINVVEIFVCDALLGNTKVISVEIIEKIFLMLQDAWKQELQQQLIRVLATCAKYFVVFERVHAHKWMALVSSENKDIRALFADNVQFIIENIMVKPEVPEEIKLQILTNIFEILKAAVKESIATKQYLRDSVLQTIFNISKIESDLIEFNVLGLLMFFVIMPVQVHVWLAIDNITEICTRRNLTPTRLFGKHKRNLYDLIVNLCVVHHDLSKRELKLTQILERVALVFGYVGPKHLISEETRHLLPYFIVLRMRFPYVQTLIDEIASVNQCDLPDLLKNNYGHIFVHTYLNDAKNYDQTTKYIEETSGMSGNALLKRNFMTILNELLLNLDEKYDLVMKALAHLANEEHDGIQQFLQSRLLGVFKYFDLKFIAPYFPKQKILLNLSKIFALMGSKCINQLRFKIIAMLQTAQQHTLKTHAKLNCSVWGEFIRCCDVDVLGPHLATIVISILPLLAYESDEINAIFNYLIIQNEAMVKHYIPDLFFIEFVEHNLDIDTMVMNTIDSYMETIKKSSFDAHLKHFLKYLNHECNDVRMYCLKYVRRLLKTHRKELDSMILGYNGMDVVIIELLEILTLGCRNQDMKLRLAYGECLAELGAIEPSHIPRKYAQKYSTFNFFMNEESFIKSALLEFIKALQAEQNTQCMDRFSLAIQETLKMHQISPDVSSLNHHLWNEFSEAHKELMLPLLSSKYAIVNAVDDVQISPIYGSNLGANFAEWLYNWTVSLISSIHTDQKELFQVYLPSMKQNHTILMHFLPYILLTVLTEAGGAVDEQKMLQEFNVVLFAAKNECLSENFVNLRPIRLENFVRFEQGSDAYRNDQYVKVIFVLLDFLERWLRECRNDARAKSHGQHYNKIKEFLSKFCKLQLAKCNFKYGEYPRALMYLEMYMQENTIQTNELLSFLSEIYYRLEEPDGVAGVAALRQEDPKLEERILALEISGKLAEAAACYERLSLPLNLVHIKGLIQCYLDLDNVNTALNFIKGALENQQEYTNWLLEAQSEPLWRLGCYDELDTLLKRDELKENKSWGVQLGHALLEFRNSQRDEFQATLKEIKTSLVDFLYSSSMEEGVYQHSYVHITRLHAITEIEQAEQLVSDLCVQPNDRAASERLIEALQQEWELRLNVVERSVRIVEPILCLRRIALEQAKHLIRDRVPHAVGMITHVIADLWLKSSKIARRAEVYQQAYTYILKAEEYQPSNLFIEKAKLHWAREEHNQALTTLERGLAKFLTPAATYATQIGKLSNEEKRICSKTKLLIARYNDDLSNIEVNEIIQHYKDAQQLFKESEKNLVHYAQYYDRILQNMHDLDSQGSTYQLHIINLFGKSLQYGTKFVYQSLPRLLSIWFDYGTRLLNVANTRVMEERKVTLLKMTKLIDNLIHDLPPYIFFTAFSQLVSRICHPQKEVYKVLHVIIAKLISVYPQQSIWIILCVIKSSYALRSKRCNEMLADPQLKTPVMLKLINDFKDLIDKLMALCTKQIKDKTYTISIKNFHPDLPRLLRDKNFSPILIPTQKYRKLILPRSDFNVQQHNPFPNYCVHIVGVKDELSILQSMQRPRRIIFIGSDGKYYPQLLKAKDDLRMDFRLMEFNDVVNQLLSANAEARQRRLHIRLYSVAPFNEECGMIEWVDNLIGLRPILLNLYQQKQLGMDNRDLSQSIAKKSDKLEVKRRIFLQKLLPRHPPVLGEWLRLTFPDAQNWMLARTAFVRTTAVMSMVGYILGLGDRHGENILIDKTCGDVVHVDFNCLFNKGETLDWPERVPFRLTHNMVDAMGPLGIEGVFKKSCACTLRVLRSNSTTLISIITPFVYDPLVSWKKTEPDARNSTTERVNDYAKSNIAQIEKRLRGEVRSNKHSAICIPLSVDGQTNNLISEAVSVDNLCQMYVGWGAFL